MKIKRIDAETFAVTRETPTGAVVTVECEFEPCANRTGMLLSRDNGSLRIVLQASAADSIRRMAVGAELVFSV